MLKITKKDKRSELEKEIDSVVRTMSTYDPSSKEYTAMANNLAKLYEANERTVERGWFRRISPDAVITVFGSLAGIGLILGYEKANIITSKAVGFIIKGRV